MTKSVTVRQAKYFMDRIKRNDLPYLKLNEHTVFDKILDAIEANSLYNNIGKQIEDEARKILKELNPKVDEIIKEINEINIKISKTKSKATKEKLQKKINDLWDDYNKLYENAQRDVDNYKIKVIVEDNRWVKIMDISDWEYNIIDNVINRTIDETKKESIADKFEDKVE